MTISSCVSRMPRGWWCTRLARAIHLDGDVHDDDGVAVLQADTRRFLGVGRRDDIGRLDVQCCRYPAHFLIGGAGQADPRPSLISSTRVSCLSSCGKSSSWLVPPIHYYSISIKLFRTMRKQIFSPMHFTATTHPTAHSRRGGIYAAHAPCPHHQLSPSVAP